MRARARACARARDCACVRVCVRVRVCDFDCVCARAPRVSHFSPLSFISSYKTDDSCGAQAVAKDDGRPDFSKMFPKREVRTQASQWCFASLLTVI